jgi:hypothetical protein
LFAGPGLAAHGTNHSFLVEVLSYWHGLGVSLTNLNFASNGTGGGLRVDAAHHVHVQDSNFLNFATQGIWGSKLLGMGHDLLVNHCRLTECTLPMAQCADISKKRATAILIEFPDSHFTNSVITCGLKGVVNRGGANTFRGLHIWTSCTGKAGESNGGSSVNTTVAFSEESGATRISDCYFDNAVLRVSGYRGSTISNSYFNAGARLELAQSKDSGKGKIDPTDANCQYWKGAVCGMVVTSNRFSCSGLTCATINVSHAIPAAASIYVHDNTFESSNASVCSTKHSCFGDSCKTLLGRCDISTEQARVKSDDELTPGSLGFTPLGRYGHCTFVVAGKMYALGGKPSGSASLSDQLMSFDPSSGKWTLLNAAASGAAPSAIDGQACTPGPSSFVYVTGGSTSGGITNKTWILDLTSPSAPIWTTGPELPTAVRRHTAVLEGTTLVLFAGSRGPSCKEHLTDAVVVASVSGGKFTSSWKTQLTDGASPGPRMGHVAVLTSQPEVAGRPVDVSVMYVIAGQTCNDCSDCYQNDAHFLDLTIWTWTRIKKIKGPPPRSRYGATGWWNGVAGGVQITGGTCGKAVSRVPINNARLFVPVSDFRLELTERYW